ncbi:MAG TPA: RDD family protein [Luteimonas sp.]
MRPAGFWRRAAAWSLDALPAAALALVASTDAIRAALGVLAGAWQGLVDTIAHRMVDAAMGVDTGIGALVALAGGALRDPAVLSAASAVQAAVVDLVVPPLLAFIALFATWCVAFERSSMRATPGKRALGMRVAVPDGSAPRTARLLLRFAAGALSWSSLNIGHLLAAVPPAHAALHDRISGTRVSLDASAPERMPGWAVAWLWLLAAGLLLATAWSAAALATAMQLALERAWPW